MDLLGHWSEAEGGRRTLIYSQIETPLGTTQGLTLADCGVALESYRIIPRVARSLKLSSQKRKYAGIIF